MATKPTARPSWTFSNPQLNTVTIAPSGDKKLTGWQAAEKPAYQTMNWLFYNLSQWVDWIAEQQETPVSIDNSDSPVAASISAPLLLVDLSSGSVEVDLPAIASSIGAEICILIVEASASGAALTVDGNASETINGKTTLIANLKGTIIRLRGMATGGWLAEVYEGRKSAVNNHVSGDSPVTLVAQDNGVVNFFTTAAGTINYVLPQADLAKGAVLKFKDIGGVAGTTAATLTPDGTDQIEGVNAAFSMEADFGVWTIQSNGTGWFFV